MRSAVLIIAWQEVVLHRRNRWVISFSVLFAGLTLLVAYFGMITSGYAGFQDFTRTSASIINLGGFLIPLFALLLGVFSFLTHREYLELLVTQPVSRPKVLLGKYLGLLLTVVGASALGFGLLGNPIDISRVLSLLQVGGPHLFGPAGATLIKFTESATLASVYGLVGLAIWIVVPLASAVLVFKRQDL